MSTVRSIKSRVLSGRICRRAPLAAAIFFGAFVATAQIIPKAPNPFPAPPSGTVGCSLQATCAELAPGMIESALGDSPLEKNFRELIAVIEGHTSAPTANEKAVAWAVSAFHEAGIADVHTESFTSPGPVQVKNVVAEIKGWDKPEEFVILGASLDLWNPGQGALDEASGDAVIVDATRVIHSSGSLPRRSIRFVLFNAGKQAMAGSRAYVVQHHAELNRAVSAIILDSGSGTVSGFSVAGRKELIPEVREALEPAKTLGVTDFTGDATIGNDNFDFLLEGVPTLLPNRDRSNDPGNYDTPSGTLDKANLAKLKKQSAIAAIAAYAVADSPQRIGTRQTRAQISQMLKDTGLDERMKQEGFWPDWLNGKRGRRP